MKGKRPKPFNKKQTQNFYKSQKNRNAFRRKQIRKGLIRRDWVRRFMYNEFG